VKCGAYFNGIAQLKETFSCRLRTSAVYMRNAKIIRHGKRVRITIDIAEALVQDIDQIRESIGVDRSALIKIWLHERVQQEKAVSSDH
jgi:hypothetical protein